MKIKNNLQNSFVFDFQGSQGHGKLENFKIVVFRARKIEEINNI